MRYLKSILLITLLIFASTITIMADVPQLVNLQGYLADDLGPVTGVYEATFRIYDDPVSGTILWSEIDSVDVNEGLYSQILGETTPISISFESDRWIGVQFTGHPEMTPRYRQTSVPYSFVAGYTDSSGTVSDDAITSSKILDGTIEQSDLAFTPLTRPLTPGVSNSEIEDNAITSGKILDGTVQEADLAFAPLTRPLTPGVSNSEIEDNAVNSAKIENRTIAFIDIGQNGTFDGQIMKWSVASNGWVSADDETGGTSWNWADSSSYGPDSVLFSNNSVYSDSTNAITDNAVTSAKIMDGTIGLIDMGQNSATDGQIIKWNAASSAWVLAIDETGGGVANGWVDDGASIRLETIGDSVGIGTANPSEKLDIDGNILVSGKATFGTNHNNTGDRAFIAGGRYNTASGPGSVAIGGQNNTSSGNESVVSGGDRNNAIGYNSTVSGGGYNTAEANWTTVGGGYGNYANGEHATIAGGFRDTVLAPYGGILSGSENAISTLGSGSFIGGGTRNKVTQSNAVIGGGFDNNVGGFGSSVLGGRNNTVVPNAMYSSILGGGYHQISANANYSSILGGYADTLSGSYSYLFGLNSNLSQDSTFMVDMPHIRFGSESTGYEFPNTTGAIGQTLVADGSGNLGWVDMTGGTGWDWSDSSSHGPDSVFFSDKSVYSDSTSAITDGAVDFADIGRNGTTHGQIMKWNGISAAWEPAIDETGSGGTANGWIDDGTYVRLEQTLDSVGIGTATPTEKLDVNGNIRVAGKGIIGSGHIYTGSETFVAGGFNNTVSGARSVALGGNGNTASGERAFMGGGTNSTASGRGSVVLGGQVNVASGDESTIGGGYIHVASGNSSTISGGYGNNALARGTAISGGELNTADSSWASIGGGWQNYANGAYSFIGGGFSDTVQASYGGIVTGRHNVIGPGGSNSFIGSGINNFISQSSAVIGGGVNNSVEGYGSAILAGRNSNIGTSSSFSAILSGAYHRIMPSTNYSTILGGYADTMSGAYSFLIGLDANLTQDSTFMVDMPHIRFGNESTGYEFPTLDGGSGQVMSTDGAGNLDWVDMGGGWNWSDSSSHGPDSVFYSDYSDSTDAITDGAIDLADIGQNGAAQGQVLKWDDFLSLWIPASDQSGGGGGGWVDDGTAIRLETNTDNVGIGTTTPSAKLEVVGDLRVTALVNIGNNNSFAGIGNLAAGVNHEIIGGNFNSITGGADNSINGEYTTISGGSDNTANAYDFIGAGVSNNASGEYNVIGGGSGNTASGDHNFIGSGLSNSTAQAYSVVAGGRENFAGSYGSTIGGGVADTANARYGGVFSGYNNKAGNVSSDTAAFVGGGSNNSAFGKYTAIVGGFGNIGNSDFNFVGGGNNNSANGEYSTIGGGSGNTTNGQYATIGGGSGNITNNVGTVAGGAGNEADYYSFVGGGVNNTAGGGVEFTAIGGGESNIVSGNYSTIGGGQSNNAYSVNSVIGGGVNNAAYVNSGVFSGHNNIAGSDVGDSLAFVGGGSGNQAIGMGSAIVGGIDNTMSGSSGNFRTSFIGGGTNNSITGPQGRGNSIVGGESNNIDNAYYSSISGGSDNYIYGDNNFIAIGDSNRIVGINNSILGGVANTIGVFGGQNNYNTILGGAQNYIRNGSEYSVILGGDQNEILTPSHYSVILGGSGNTVTDWYSLAFGENAHSDNLCAVFFNGLTEGRFAINRDISDNLIFPFQVGVISELYNGNGAHVTGGGLFIGYGLREPGFNPSIIQSANFISKISNLSIQEWETTESGEKHIGPNSDQFVAAFDVGTIRESDGKRDDRYLAASDVAGVALAGVQELINIIEKQSGQIEQLERRLTELEKGR